MSNIYNFDDYDVFNDLIDAISYRFHKCHQISSNNLLLLLLTYNNITKENFDNMSEENKLFFINMYALDTITKLLQINIIIKDKDSGLNYKYYSTYTTINNIYLLKISLCNIAYLYYLDEHNNICHDGTPINNSDILSDDILSDDIMIDNTDISIDEDNIIYDNNGNIIFSKEEYNDLLEMIS